MRGLVVCSRGTGGGGYKSYAVTVLCPQLTEDLARGRTCEGKVFARLSVGEPGVLMVDVQGSAETAT